MNNMQKSAQTMSRALSPAAKNVQDPLTTAFNTAVANSMVPVAFHLNIGFDPAANVYVVEPAFTSQLTQAQKHAIGSNFYRALGATLLANQAKLDWRYTPTSGKNAMDERTATLKLLAVVKKQQAMIEKLAQSINPTSPASVLPADDNNAMDLAARVKMTLNKAFAPFQVSVLSVDGVETGVPTVKAQVMKSDHPEGEASLLPRLKQAAMNVLHGLAKDVKIILWWK
jgi:hypothetical protein